MTDTFLNAPQLIDVPVAVNYGMADLAYIYASFLEEMNTSQEPSNTSPLVQGSAPSTTATTATTATPNTSPFVRTSSTIFNNLYYTDGTTANTTIGNRNTTATDTFRYPDTRRVESYYDFNRARGTSYGSDITNHPEYRHRFNLHGPDLGFSTRAQYDEFIDYVSRYGNPGPGSKEITDRYIRQYLENNLEIRLQMTKDNNRIEANVVLFDKLIKKEICSDSDYVELDDE
jgi:hypothetical protein